MRKIAILSVLAGMVNVLAYAQDPDINIVTQQSNTNDGAWVLGATDGTVDVTVCNNPTNGSIPTHRIYAQVSVPSQCVEIANSASQVLPSGWHIVSNDGQTIVVCNGTDVIPALDCRNFDLVLNTTAVSNPANVPQTITSTIGFYDGTTAHNFGPQTTLNSPANDNSVTTVVVTSAPLPVTLEQFYGKLEGDLARLFWEVSNEKYFSHYEIERSFDGASFETIGEVKALGKHQYRYDDDLSGYSGIAYYRLKMVDADKEYKYSAIVKFKLQGGIVVTDIWPNPATNSLNIRLNLDEAHTTQVRLLDVSGKTVRVGTSDMNAGINTFRLSNLGELARGLYIIRIEQGTHVVMRKVSLQ